MPRHVYLFSGASAMGKTPALKALFPLLGEGGTAPCVCKIDCLETGDRTPFQCVGLLCVTGLGGDVCSDRFLAPNLPELWDWANRLKRDTLVIETARLCRRCSPAMQYMTAGCMLDCTVSCRASGQLGPMLAQADLVVLTRINMAPQAELEIISWQTRQINPGAVLLPVDGLTGYGAGLLARWLLNRSACGNFEGDTLRHTALSGVRSYCVGEQRVGSVLQQGVVDEINSEGAEVCSL